MEDALNKRLLEEIDTGSFTELLSVLSNSPNEISPAVFKSLANYLSVRDGLAGLEEVAKACGYKPSTIKTHRSKGTISELWIPPMVKQGKRLVCLRSTLNKYLMDQYSLNKIE